MPQMTQRNLNVSVVIAILGLLISLGVIIRNVGIYQERVDQGHARLADLVDRVEALERENETARRLQALEFQVAQLIKDVERLSP